MDAFEIYHEVGGKFFQYGYIEDAILALRQAIRLEPQSESAHTNLGVALTQSGRVEEGIEELERAIEIAPDNGDTLINLGLSFYRLGRVAESLIPYRKAIKLMPASGDAHFNYGTSLMALGDFEQGLPELEHRVNMLMNQNNEHLAAMKTPPMPRWDGRPAETLLIHHEQGYGDTLQFVRYLPIIAQRCKKLVFVCPPQVEDLFRYSFKQVANLEIYSRDIPGFHTFLSLFSVPYVLGTTLDSIPSSVPYLFAPPHFLEKWTKKLENIPHKRVGLCWAGRTGWMANRRRSMALADIAKVTIPGVSFISLQKDNTEISSDFGLYDFTSEIESWSDTAALIAQLDLVITVDTAVAHLAGAMGKPVWLLNRFDTCWRWMLDRSDSPWYPSMTILRQPQPGDWASVLDRVRCSLSQKHDGRSKTVTVEVRKKA